MAVQYDKRLRYPEEYIIEEDLKEMGEINIHRVVTDQVASAIKQLFKAKGWLVVANMDVTHPAIRNSLNYIVPDITFVKAVLSPKEFTDLSRWNALIHPPEVVFEISSKSTWTKDVGTQDSDKPAIYGRIGVKEYFAYDPNTPQVWEKSKGVRLRGWRYVDQQPVEMVPDEQGRLWSEELESYLVPAGKELYLTDRDGQKRLSAEERSDQAEQREAQARQDAQLAHQREAQAQQEIERVRQELAELKKQLGKE